METEGRAIVQERLIEAPVERVFAALHTPAQMARWLAPGEVASARVETDFRVGGRFSVVMHGVDREYAQHGEYLVIDPPKRLIFTWVSDFLPEVISHTRVTVTLDAVDPGRTRLRLVHDQLPAAGAEHADAYDGHEEGWRSILEKLAALVATQGEPT